MMMDLAFFPVVVEDHGVFHAPDPWAGNAMTAWRLVGYQMHTTQIHPPYPPKPGSPQEVQIGIQAVEGPRYRVLPLGVQPVYREGSLPAERIPAVLHAIEGGLRSGDYAPRRAYSGLAMTYTGFALLIYLGWYASLTGNDRVMSIMLLWIAHAVAGLSAVSLLFSWLAQRRRERIGNLARKRVLEFSNASRE